MTRADTFFVDFGDGVLEDYFGTSLSFTYRPKSGDPVTVDAIIVSDSHSHESDADGDFLRKTLVVYVKQSDIAQPLLNATAEVDGIEYRLSKVGPLVGDRWRIDLIRVGASELVRPGYRSG